MDRLLDHDMQEAVDGLDTLDRLGAQYGVEVPEPTVSSPPTIRTALGPIFSLSRHILNTLLIYRMDAASPCAIAIRLADEGVPLRAIARATEIPSTKLYETLTLARMEGKLLSLPRDDWPPGCPRDQRSLQLSRMAAENHDTLMLAIQKLFELPAQPAKLLLLLVQHEQVPHARIDVDRKVCAVYVCKMRQSLLKHGLKIKTIWGYGYQLSQEHRRKAMDLILSRVTLP